MDKTENILCNQWYHRICIETSNNSISVYFNQNEIFLGGSCNHKMWYNNLNDETQKIVAFNIWNIHQHLESTKF